MKAIPKPILIALIVVLLLFVVFVVMGGTSGSKPESNDPSPGWADGLGKTVVKRRPLQARDIRSSCFSGSSLRFTFSFPVNCTAEVVQDEARIREGRLQLAAGSVIVTVHQKDPDTTRDMPLPDDDGDTGFDLDAFRDGMDLTLRCAFGTCSVDLVPIES